jgi:hypothetical protein
MLCITCQNECPDKDFILNQTDCFRCVYKKKCGNNKKGNLKSCKICKGPLGTNLKQIYCCPECASKGYDQVRQERWGMKYVGCAGKF